MLPAQALESKLSLPENGRKHKNMLYFSVMFLIHCQQIRDSDRAAVLSEAKRTPQRITFQSLLRFFCCKSSPLPCGDADPLRSEPESLFQAVNY